MSRRRPRLALASLVTGILTLTAGAEAQQIKSRVMVLLDTSGSMGMHFADPTTGGDFPGGDGSTSYSDVNLTNQYWYPGKLLSNGTRDGVNSRLYAAKSALSDAVNAYSGNIDFGLMTYDFGWCSFASPLCEQCTSGTTGYNCLYADNAFTVFTQINWVSNGCSAAGGKILVPPQTGSGTKILPWIDGVEVFKNDGTGQPVNPELRADGSTPLASSISLAKTSWYDAIKTAGSDPQLLCRPYVLIVETDGADSCGGNVVNSVKALYQDNPSNPVLTYVIGVSINSTDQATLNSAAAAGGTGSARFATSQADIEAAYADILAKSVKIEKCNNLDDNCNGVVDEGFNKGASCSVGVGACLRNGITKCNSTQDGTTCCVNDGNPNSACTPLVAGTPTTEICNGIDDDCNGLVDEGGVCAKCSPTAEVCDGLDNDCDGIIDDNVTGVGASCGLTLGACTPGKTVCENSAGVDITKGGTADAGDHLACVGGVGPQPETCNGIDDDCDGVIDGMTRPCYDGAMGTLGVGICVGGVQKCNATVGSGVASWGACAGEVTPKSETCNGADDDCDGVVDDVPGAGTSCCPLGKCGTGICKAGTMQCSAGTLQCIGSVGPQVETCNGVDDDCNGVVDDVPGTGVACNTGSVLCGAGVTACDAKSGGIVCRGLGKGTKEICNGVDDDCNGIVDDVNPADDPKIGVPCGPTTTLPPPCAQGKTVCKNGSYVCEGAVGPAKEVCNGKDDDCDGKVDVGATCPSGYDCLQGGCYKACDPGAIPCAGGYVCDATTNHCLPGDCTCSSCQKCEGGKCVDFCADVQCPDTWKCDCGACVDDSCAVHGCPDGQVCDQVQRACVPLPSDAGVDADASMPDATGGEAGAGSSGGCGCEVPDGRGEREGTRWAALGGLALALVIARRRASSKGGR